MSLRHKRSWHFAFRSSLLGGVVPVALVQAVFAQRGRFAGSSKIRPAHWSPVPQWSCATPTLGSTPKQARQETFCFDRVKPREYELTVQANGFRTDRRKITVDSTERANLTISLDVESENQQVTVVEGSADVGSLNVAQTQIGTGLIENLPSESVNAALSSILTLATPGVAADSNGVFHPLGEHAETSFNVDGQPISDQQSRIFSNQISANTIQEMRTLQGAPPAEFGDKTSLIVEATTRSGLNSGKANGTISLGLWIICDSHRERRAGLRFKNVWEFPGAGWSR